MSSRIDLQSKLEELLGSRNVYYQPPSTVMLNYPAIIYSKTRISSKFANDAKYSKMNCYELIVIDRKPDNPVIDKLLQLPMCRLDTHYISDNLNHDVFTLYY